MEHGGPVVHGADTSSPTPRGRLRSGDRQPGVDSSAATRAVTGHSPARGRTARPAARCAHPSRPGTEVPPVAPRPALHGLLSARTSTAGYRADGHEGHLLDLRHTRTAPAVDTGWRDASPPFRSWVPRAFGWVRGSFLVTPMGCLVVGRSGCVRGAARCGAVPAVGWGVSLWWRCAAAPREAVGCCLAGRGVGLLAACWWSALWAARWSSGWASTWLACGRGWLRCGLLLGASQGTSRRPARGRS